MADDIEESVERLHVAILRGGESFLDLVIAWDEGGIAAAHQGDGFLSRLRLALEAVLPAGMPCGGLKASGGEIREGVGKVGVGLLHLVEQVLDERRVFRFLGQKGESSTKVQISLFPESFRLQAGKLYYLSTHLFSRR